jgi:Icc-related predicted phosphoesterase
LRLWAFSDLHLEKGEAFAPAAPDCDGLVCAGDVSNDFGRSLATLAALARGRPAILVAGNHEYWSGDTIEVARILAEHAGVHLLECDTVTIDGVTFAGATLWEDDDARCAAASDMLAAARADVVVTHYPPTADRVAAITAPLWIHGHVHGRGAARLGDTLLVRNARGYPGEAGAPAYGASAAPFDPRLVIRTGPRRVRNSSPVGV